MGDRPGINAGTGSPGMRCVFEGERDPDMMLLRKLCGRPGIGMFEQKAYCEEHMHSVEEHYWAQHRRTEPKGI